MASESVVDPSQNGWILVDGKWKWEGISADFFDSENALEAIKANDLDMEGKRVLFANVYPTEVDLPDAAIYHGMFAHVHQTGSAYFSHSGNWIKLARQTAVSTGHDSDLTQGQIDSSVSNLVTTDIAEGTNLYYTDDRVMLLVDSAYVNSLITLPNILDSASTVVLINETVDSAYINSLVTISEGHDSVLTQNQIDSSLGELTTDSIPEGMANLYYTDDRADIRATLRINDATTDNIDEGTGNLYYTDSRVETLVDSAYVNALVTIPTGFDSANAVQAVTSSDLDMDGNKVLFANAYPTVGDLPSASTYPGMVANVISEGNAYHAHGGDWFKLANTSDVPDGSNFVDLTSDQTISGDKSFTDNVEVSGTVTVGSTINSKHIVPVTADTYSLGSNARPFLNVNANDGFFSGTVSADKFNSFIVGAGLNETFTLNGKSQPQYGINWDMANSAPVGMSGYFGLSFATQGAERFSIAGNGDATFSGNVSAGGYSDASSSRDIGATLFSQGAISATRDATNATLVLRQKGSGDIARFYGPPSGINYNNHVASISGAGDFMSSGTVNANDFSGYSFKRPGTSYGVGINSGGAFKPSENGTMDLGLVRVDANDYKWKDGHFAGTVTANTFNGNVVRSSHVIQDGAPVIDAKGLITTLSTLRNATKDETTLEGLRDSLSSAIATLIATFESEIVSTPINAAIQSSPSTVSGVVTHGAGYP